MLCCLKRSHDVADTGCSVLGPPGLDTSNKISRASAGQQECSSLSTCLQQRAVNLHAALGDPKQYH